MNILDILDELGASTKRGHKIALIEQNRNNELFTRVLKLALDPYVNFDIRKIPDYTFKLLEKDEEHESLEWALDELEKLSSRQLTGHAGISHLQNILSELNTPDAVVIERVIGKDLRCGVADGIVNAVIDNHIPSYPCLLARPFDEKNIKNISYPAYSQLKADGLRVNIHVYGQHVSVCGRSGRDIDLHGIIDPAFVGLAQKFSNLGVAVVFDGELVVLDDFGKILPRKVGNGIINKAIKGTISEAEAKRVRVQLWDIIPLTDFKKGVSKHDYKSRFETLENLVKEVCTNPNHKSHNKYWIIPSKVVNSLDEAVDHFNELLAAGEEGTILKNFEGLWEDSRSKHLVKMKAEKTCDLEVIGYNPGQGKYTGMVGSIRMASSDRKVEVSISGMSEELRRDVTARQDELLGTIIEVMYNERISSEAKNRAGIDSLFLPRVHLFREDKTVANSSDEIK